MLFEFLGAVDDVVWSYIAPVLILAFGIFASVVFKFPWVRHFKRMFKNMFAKPEGEGASPFGTLCVALGGQIGTGNVVGVATAIASGGPGALFWMWITAILGMTTSLCETTLAQLYKQRNNDGTYRGGGVYYIRYGLKSKALAAIMAVAVALGSGMADCMSHVNGIYSSINEVVSVNPWVVGIVLALAAGAIIYGGFKRAVKFSEVVVPFMAVGYILVSLAIIILNIKLIPSVFGMIFKCAFNFKAAGGGILGYTVAQAFRYGMARGIFSNEAGMGTTCNINASSSGQHPVTQGILGMCGVFVDTILVCTATGIIILLSGAYGTAESGAALTQAAFGTFMGTKAAQIFVAVVLFFFAFTSLVASFYCGRVAVQYLFGDNQKYLLGYLVLEMIVSVLGAVTSPDNVFLVIDLTNGLMIVPNIIALFCLYKKANLAFLDYETQLKNGVKDPLYNWEKFREENGLASLSAAK